MTISKKPVLYVVVCAAPPASTIYEFVTQTQQLGWNTCIITTPQAMRWVDIPRLETLTGHVVRTDYKLPGQADPLPKADTIIVIPATFNTINKLATGIADTLAVSILCEALGRGAPPIIMVPCLKMDLVHHPAFSRNIVLLKETGVHILHEPEHYRSPLMVPWDIILHTLGQVFVPADPLCKEDPLH